MTIGLKRANPGSDEARLTSLDHACGLDWPADIRAFLRSHDGGVPEPNVFEVQPGLRGSVTQFYSVSEILRQKTALSDRLSVNLWPIAVTESGNFVLLELGTWKIVFFDHETEEVLPVADTFSEFTDKLQPFSPPKLRPGQVLGVYRSPGFDEKFKGFKRK